MFTFLPITILGPTMVAPGDTFAIRIDPPRPSNSISLELRYLDQVVRKWQLQPGIRDIKIQAPQGDGKGYLLKVSEFDRNQKLIAQSSKGLDMSTSWKKFPRYGYVTDFSQDPKEARKMILKMASQGVNIIQFYDWMNKHHVPLGPGKEWKDIANRTVKRETILAMTDECRKLGVQSMAYNLMFGAYDDAFQDDSGVSPSWQLFKDSEQKEPWTHGLPSGWATPRLRLLDPSIPGWQDYLNGQMGKAIRELGFDGWHIDQLGDHGDLYGPDRAPKKLNTTFASFLSSARKAFPKRPLIFNNVAGYGLPETATSSVDCIYIEAWDWYAKTYSDLCARIQEARQMTKFKKQVVIAGYINSQFQEQFSGKSPGAFNEASFSSTLATILASGGWWLGPGDGNEWLGAEYFPNKNLKLSDNSREILRRYTAFGIAYQNLLRGDLKLVSSSGWDKETAVLRFENDRTVVIHLLNFNGIGNRDWRDLQSTAKLPNRIADPRLLLGPDQFATDIQWVRPGELDLTPQKVSLVSNEAGFELPLDPKANWQVFFWRK